MIKSLGPLKTFSCSDGTCNVEMSLLVFSPVVGKDLLACLMWGSSRPSLMEFLRMLRFRIRA